MVRKLFRQCLCCASQSSFIRTPKSSPAAFGLAKGAVLATEPRHPCRLTRVFKRRYSKTLPPRPLDTLGSFYENQGKDD